MHTLTERLIDCALCALFALFALAALGDIIRRLKNEEPVE